jgi:tRNA threonylcarbamoyladenosine biosynthesis protein TsaE
LSDSAEATERVGAILAERLCPGDVVAVSGELGSGKTTFVRGACQGLGVSGRVTSPTYTLAHRYAGDVAVSHLDLYRVRRLTDADWAGLAPYLDDAVVFVEWPEAGEGRLPAARVRVRLAHAGEDRREITVESEEDELLAGLG